MESITPPPHFFGGGRGWAPIPLFYIGGSLIVLTRIWGAPIPPYYLLGAPIPLFYIGGALIVLTLIWGGPILLLVFRGGGGRAPIPLFYFGGGPTPLF